MKAPNRMVRSIFQLNSSIQMTFFKDFMQSYDVPKGLNHTHLKTLMIIKFHGTTTMSDISAILTLENGSFTPVANRLIKMGYITKERNPEDRRVSNLSLTQTGESLASDFASKHHAYMESILDDLSHEERETFMANMESITATISQITGREMPPFPLGQAPNKK